MGGNLGPTGRIPHARPQFNAHVHVGAGRQPAQRGASEGGRREEIWVLRGASRMPAPSSTHTCMLAQDDSLHREGPVKAGDGRKSGSYGAHPACAPPVQRTRACWRRTTACTEGPVKAGDGRKSGSYGAHPACAPPVQRARACWRRTTACTEGPVKAGDGRKNAHVHVGAGRQPAQRGQ